MQGLRIFLLHNESSWRSNLTINFDTSRTSVDFFLVLCLSIFVHGTEQTQETTSSLMSVVVQHRNMTDSMALFTDTDGTTETDNTW